VQWDRDVGLLSLAAAEPFCYAPQLKQYGYLLFSTHGVIVPGQAAYSFIALSDPAATGHTGPSPPREDGRLFLSEAFGLDLNARMVTLSACQTAEGDFARGEGVLGLTAAFFCAGARAITASVWEVSDESTAELIGRYHELMAAGLPPAQALQQAQLQTLTQAREAFRRAPESAGARYAHPYFWAPFLLLGR
jgi:CHAT domain-containing protein